MFGVSSAIWLGLNCEQSDHVTFPVIRCSVIRSRLYVKIFKCQKELDIEKIQLEYLKSANFFPTFKKKKKKKNFFHFLFIGFYDEIELLDLTFIGIEVVNKFFKGT